MEGLLHFGQTALGMIRDVLPIAAILIGFQLFILRRPIHNPMRVGVGLIMVLLGLALFLEGLELALFPLGRLMANQLTAPSFLFGPGADAVEAFEWSDFLWVYLFAGAMQRSPGKKTLLHCQANYRASAFSFLYRVLYEGVPMATAKKDLDSVWTPNQTWRELIFTVLKENDVSPHCDGCVWQED